MHEVGIMHSTLDYAEEQARSAGATAIHRLRMRVGGLSGVVTDALQFAFEALSPQTMAAGATLEIEDVIPACWCPHCQAEFEVDDFVFLCPRCQQPCSELRRGRELELASMEIS
jgi:hydrogenase nickel incorporation protein HypA/HybF